MIKIISTQTNDNNFTEFYRGIKSEFFYRNTKLTKISRNDKELKIRASPNKTLLSLWKIQRRQKFLTELKNKKIEFSRWRQWISGIYCRIYYSNSGHKNLFPKVVVPHFEQPQGHDIKHKVDTLTASLSRMKRRRNSIFIEPSTPRFLTLNSRTRPSIFHRSRHRPNGTRNSASWFYGGHQCATRDVYISSPL